MVMTGADILVASLEEQGVEVLFGYPGGSVIEIYDALYKRRDHIRHILTSHEQGAIHAADGYSRTTNKTGVALATSGPGATNLVTGIATAYMDSTPLVAITGNVARSMLGRDSFQEIDIVGVTIPITKHSFIVRDIKDIPEVVKKAFTIANSDRPGPVLIDFPKDVTLDSTEYVPAGKFEKRPTPSLDLAQIAQAVEAIKHAKRPCIYFGGGIKHSRAEAELLEFSEKLDLPLVSTIMGLSCVPYDNPRYLGMLGMHGRPVSNKAVNDCDLLIALGARFSDRVLGNKFQFAPDAEVIHVDMDISEIGKNLDVDYPVQGDLKDVLRQFIDRSAPRKCTEWNEALQEYKRNVGMPKINRYGGLDPRKVVDAVSEITKDEAIVVTDVGQHQMLVTQSYKFTKPRSLCSSCGLGTMGFGMGAANGVQVGNPGRPVVLFTGDGSFHMNMNEFAVAVTNNLPIVVLVYNNSVLGMVRQWQKLFYEERYSNTDLHRKTDFVKLAEAFGGTGFRMESDDQIYPILEKAFATDGPVIVDCIVDKEYGVFPFIPSGKSFAEMILDDIH